MLRLMQQTIKFIAGQSFVIDKSYANKTENIFFIWILIGDQYNVFGLPSKRDYFF
jgi:hypothetical protein